MYYNNQWDKDYAVWYYGNTCHNCKKSTNDLQCVSLTDPDKCYWIEPEELLLLCDECYDGLPDLDLDQCRSNQSELGLHKMVLAFQRYYDGLEDSGPYNYIYDLIQALRGHSEYIDCVDIHAPYHLERPKGQVILTNEQFLELATMIYNDLCERGELNAEYY